MNPEVFHYPPILSINALFLLSAVGLKTTGRPLTLGGTTIKTLTQHSLGGTTIKTLTQHSLGGTTIKTLTQHDANYGMLLYTRTRLGLNSTGPHQRRAKFCQIHFTNTPEKISRTKSRFGSTIVLLSSWSNNSNVRYFTKIFFVDIIYYYVQYSRQLMHSESIYKYNCQTRRWFYDSSTTWSEQIV